MFLYAAMGYVEVAMVSSSLCLFLMVFIFKDVAVGQFGLYNHRYIFFVEVALPMMYATMASTSMVT